MSIHRFVWGKSHISKPNEDDSQLEWLPLWMHLKDTIEVSEKLWAEWVPNHTKRTIAKDLDISVNDAGILVAWLSGLHDMGKSTPDFFVNKGQVGAQKSAQMANERMYRELRPKPIHNAIIPRHEVAGLGIAKRMLRGEFSIVEMDRKFDNRLNSLLMPIAGHHGTFAESGRGSLVEDYVCALDKSWIVSQDEIFKFVNEMLPTAQVVAKSIVSRGASQRVQLLITSLVVMSDWFASSFPLIPINEVPDPSTLRGDKRSLDGMNGIALPPVFDGANISENSAHDRSMARFGFPPNAMQKEFLDFVSNHSDEPDIYILEASMGGGKTEASLLAAEELMRKHELGGVYFGLPTMSTTESIYNRVVPYVENLLRESGEGASLALLHSKDRISQSYNDSFARSKNGKSPISTEGSLHRKELRLSNSFVVGTIDQMLMMSLRTKHNFLRHLGLSSKVVILDEVHSADDYMLEYLKRSLVWLGFYGSPVILLSATLTNEVAQSLVNAYQRGRSLGNEVTK